MLGMNKPGAARILTSVSEPDECLQVDDGQGRVGRQRGVP